MNASQSNLIKMYREFGDRWRYLNLCLMKSPSFRCPSAAVGQSLPPLPQKLLARALGEGACGWRWPLVTMSQVWFRPLDSFNIQPEQEDVRDGRISRRLTIVDSDGTPVPVEGRCDYFVFYDIRGCADDFGARSILEDEARMAADEFESIVRKAAGCIDIDVEPMVGVNDDGKMHDGKSTPPGWKDLLKWSNVVFSGQELEPILADKDAPPWYLASLAPNLGKASAAFVETVMEVSRKPYLGLVMAGTELMREGHEEVSFGRNAKPLQLIQVLIQAGARGLPRATIHAEIYGGRGIGDNALDQIKSKAQQIISPLRIEVAAGGGTWRLTSL